MGDTPRRPGLFTATATFGGGGSDEGAGQGGVAVPSTRPKVAPRGRAVRSAAPGWVAAPTGPLTEHFSWDEAKCPCCGCVPDIAAVMAFAGVLEGVRRKLGRAIRINSWCRCPKHNTEVCGVKDSQHLKGCAADIRVDTMAPKRVQQALHNWPGGLGVYVYFTHIDTGPKRRWDG